MILTPKTFLIVCPLVFLAGLVNAIAELPVHSAIVANKMSSTCGVFISTLQFFRHGYVNVRLAIPSVIAAILGSSLGAGLSLLMPEEVLTRVPVVVLPVAAIFVLNPKLFKNPPDGVPVTKKTFLVGIYDSFCGPGTGTFLIIAFTVFAKPGIRSASAETKCINLSSNVTALTLYLISGNVLVILGLAAAACNIAGNLIGSRIVMNHGARVVRPLILVVLVLLLLRVLGVY